MAGGTNVLSAEGLAKRFGERLLFDEVTFGLAEGQKAALIARNGTGKTTLLRAICGTEPADAGRVSIRAGVRWALLDQEPDFAPDATVLDALYSGSITAVQAVRTYAAAAALGDAEALQRATDAMDATGGWDYEARAREVLGKLNLHAMDRKVATLSGGERRRIALARVLIEEPDLLFLDEPTNHLDLEMVQWLEKHLAAARTTLLMVTHDRYFLENVCGTLFELDGGRLHKYQGNYAYFLEKRAERIDNAHAVRDRARSVLRRELEWMRATPSARTGKSKSRIDRFYEIREEARKRLEDDPLHLHLNPERLGGKVIELHKVRLAYGERVLIDGLTHAFKRGERIGIVGANGAGKSSLLDLIVGKSEPTGGKVVIGETVVFGHFHQHGAQFPEEMRVLEAVRSIAEFMPLQKGAKLLAADLLERFLFPRHTHHNYVRVLSGGEKKRLHLLQVLMRNPNVLILDEPTNDLDIFTLQVLEEFLFDYPGCLIVVSHDRYFMDRLVEHVWVLGEDGSTAVRDYPGNYTQYRLARDEARKEAASAPSPVSSPTPASAPPKGDYSKRLSFKEKFEYEQLPAQIAALESRKHELSTALASATDHEALLQLSADLGTVSAELDAAEERWLELAERNGD